ncbi:MAG: DUF2851 family protein [Lentisphaeria bacterium]|nr:DUF2851 family protein [Lentisphaeria bacterium]
MHVLSVSAESLMDLAERWYVPLRHQASRIHLPLNNLGEHSDGRNGCQFSERFLQILWNEERFDPDRRTVAGQTLEIVSAGTWNVGGGPDFRDAVLRLDGRIVRGDVEVHRHEGDWFRHGHHRDENYDQVILHAVWEPEHGTGPTGVPVFAIRQHLQRPWRELLEELQTDIYPYARKVPSGECALRWALSDDDAVGTILEVAGLARFEDKTLRLERRAASAGMDQALYEGLFEALGYKLNKHPFRRLAEAVPLRVLKDSPDDCSREALLFGAAGLLPDPSAEPVLPRWRRHVGQLWDRWWQSGGTPLQLTWTRAGLRPFNTPERRLAAGVELLNRVDADPCAWLLRLADDTPDPQELVRALRRSFAFRSDWEHSKDYTTALKRPGQLIGAGRADDIIVNILLPFLCFLGRDRRDQRLVTLAHEALRLVGPLQNNRMLREATHRFFMPPTRAKTIVRSACRQQGLLEIYRSFCMTLSMDCASCPFISSGEVAQQGF